MIYMDITIDVDEYPLAPGSIKEVLKENKFPTHKINNDLK